VIQTEPDVEEKEIQTSDDLQANQASGAPSPKRNQGLS
jgi:hypothetical protein